ncbi:MAG: hypothetical protein JSW41_05785 [Candidatus Aenigmatarchaeota archaeon]|nr:MAG: hypothetical protein JSW41_05785 [Candidatus Aenigmarchaeota archaeon]
MLKKLVFVLILLVFVLSAASYMTGFITIESSEGMKISMSILTDTETYHSGEFMEARVSTACDKDLDSVIVKIYGIKDRFGKYNINEEKIVQINSPGNETVFLVRMPRCYGCAGISPGEYEVTAELIYNNIVVGNTSKTITLVK